MAWSILILIATSLPGSTLPKVEFEFADKLVHFVLYAVLGALVARAISDRDSVPMFVLAFGILVVFGLVDELHQTLMRGRSTDLFDWLADSLGAGLGILTGKFLLPLARPRQDLQT